MLDDLRRLRAVQMEQAEALAAADLDALERLDGERRALQARIVPREGPPLSEAERAEARALIAVIERDQRELAERAEQARAALRRELGRLGAGRAALAGYRPPPAGRSLYLDRAR